MLPFTLTNIDTGAAVINTAVTFTLQSGNGQLITSAALTNASGVAYAQITATSSGIVSVRGGLIDIPDIYATGEVLFSAVVPGYDLTVRLVEDNRPAGSEALVIFTLKNTQTQIGVSGKAILVSVVTGPASVESHTLITDGSGNALVFVRSAVPGTSIILGQLSENPSVSASVPVTFV
ncbi:TPA: hypothetical protein ACPY75_004271, partial [Yersinia enterocolitica]